MSGVRKREYGNRTDQGKWGIKEGANPEMLTNEKLLMLATLCGMVQIYFLNMQIRFQQSEKHNA